MNLEAFKYLVSRQGTAKSSRWVCNVFPPPSLSQSTNSLKTASGSSININLPGLDILNNAIGDINKTITSVNDMEARIGNTVVNTNLNVPTLGYLVRNTASGLNAISMYCQSCALPARDLLNSEWTEYGELRSLGVKHTHGDLTISYLCSEDLRERNFFEQWQNLIFNPINKRHSYYKDYISRIEIVKYDTGWTKQMATYQFNEAYPTNVGETSLSYEGTDVIKLDIVFKYRNYERIA